MKEDKILSAESVLNNLIAELERVKKAAEQLDDARKTVVTVTEASEKVTKGMNTLINTANKVLKNIEEAKIREQYDKVEKELTEFTNKTEKIMGDISSMENTVSSE
jgi:ribonuclease HI